MVLPLLFSISSELSPSDPVWKTRVLLTKDFYCEKGILSSKTHLRLGISMQRSYKHLIPDAPAVLHMTVWIIMVKVNRQYAASILGSLKICTSCSRVVGGEGGESISFLIPNK